MPSSKDVGIAFALVIGAGAATAIGAAVVFIPSAVKYANRKTLAGSLGLSAGVMTYVSFVEIFQKSVGSFADAGFGDKDVYLYATLCFFGGVVFMVILNQIVTRLLRGEHHHHSHGGDIAAPGDDVNRTTRSTDSTQSNNNNKTQKPAANVDDPHTCEIVAPCACCSEHPARDLENIKHMAEDAQPGVQHQRHCPNHEAGLHGHGDHEHVGTSDVGEGTSSDQDDAGADDSDDGDAHDEAKLMRMSINTAVAIGLHNFPEGLATFVATLDDPRVGFVLAVAIAIHNIPEGLCVAMPIYYATGKRWKAFGWACLSGVSEPVAAILGWAVLSNTFSDTLYAVLFGMVGGMMVIISARELLPTAHRYDPEDCVVTFCYIGGMSIMAASLLLFSQTS